MVDTFQRVVFKEMCLSQKAEQGRYKSRRLILLTETTFFLRYMLRKTERNGTKRMERFMTDKNPTKDVQMYRCGTFKDR